MTCIHFDLTPQLTFSNFERIIFFHKIILQDFPTQRIGIHMCISKRVYFHRDFSSPDGPREKIRISIGSFCFQAWNGTSFNNLVKYSRRY